MRSAVASAFALLAACGPGSAPSDEGSALAAHTASCQAAVSGTGAAAAWCRRGRAWTWQGHELFGGCAGDPARPAILLVHGFPTSSFDFAALVDDLSRNYRVCWLDTLGYGFSDKPADHAYSLFEDADAVETYVREVAHLSAFALVTHDKGDSVGLEVLRRHDVARAAGGDPGYRITQHVLLNGNIYLPLANLTELQLQLLDPETGDEYAESLSGTQLAAGLGATAYSPALSARARGELAKTFDYQDGTSVMDSTVQYLNEREQYELMWLDALAASPVPLTMFWGELDEIAPVAVPDYVWDNYVATRAAPARDYRHPCANHYLPSDHAGDVAAVIRSAMSGQAPALGSGACAPYLAASHE